MKKLLWVILAVGAGVIGFNYFNRAVARTLAGAKATDRECVLAANRVAETQKMASDARASVLRKKNRSRDAARHPEFSPDLLALLENEASKGNPGAWAELRERLGIGWDSSPDYVLVRKGMLKQLHFGHVQFEQGRVRYDAGAMDQVVAMLGLSPDERSAFQRMVGNARDGQALINTRRIQPGGDVVAQYTTPSGNPSPQTGGVDIFSTDVASLLGPERAALLIPYAWDEIGSIWPDAPETVTIRRVEVDGQPDLVCELTQGGHTSTNPVRDGQNPTRWFMALFPGGWASLAVSEGFSLPPHFKN